MLADRYERQLPVTMEQLCGNVQVFVWYCNGRHFVSRQSRNALEIVRTLSNGEKYLAVHSAWFHKFMMGSLCARPEWYIAELGMESE